jgi:hypothetical protein
MHSRIEIVVTLRTLLVMAVLAAFPSLGFATRIIIGGNDPIPTTPVSTTLNEVQVNTSPFCQNGTLLNDGADCEYGFTNDTANIIDSFTFKINGIDQTDANQILNNDPCDVTLNAYFLNCSVNYSSSTLTYSFSGVNPPDGDETPGPGFDQEIGQQEGIPPTGSFLIDLQDWNTGTLGNDLSSISLVNSFTTVPEASSPVVLLTDFLLFAGVLVLLGRRLKWNRQVDL